MCCLEGLWFSEGRCWKDLNRQKWPRLEQSSSSHLCRAHFFAHICGKKRARIVLAPWSLASDTWISICFRYLPRNSTGTKLCWGSCGTWISEIHPHLSQESGFNGLHTRWWYSCCCEEDGSWKNRSIARGGAGGRGRGRGFCFSFLLFRVFMIPWREKEALEVFQGFSFRVWRSWRKLTVLGCVFSSLRR